MIKKRDSVYVSREELPLSRLYFIFIREHEIPEALFLELIRHVSRNYGVPPGKLRPSDRFESELSPSKFNEWDSARSILMYELAALGKNKGKAVAEPKDLDGYIRTMAEVY